MRLVLDSSVLIDHLRGQPGALKLMREAVTGGDELWSVAVVRTEVLAGMLPGEETETFELFDRLRWVDVTVDFADRAGQLARRYARSHPGIDAADYCLAAAAEFRDAELKTQNVKHFPMLPGLAPAYR